MKAVLLSFLVVVVSSFAYAEEEFKVFGSPSVAFNTNNSFLNFGGPNLKFEQGRIFGGFSFFPSLRLDNTGVWTPILGVGAFIGHDRVFVAIPNYYYSGAWYTAFGLGYKF